MKRIQFLNWTNLRPNPRRVTRCLRRDRRRPSKINAAGVTCRFQGIRYNQTNLYPLPCDESNFTPIMAAIELNSQKNTDFNPSIASLRDAQIFNHSQRFIQGWYWAIPSRELKPGQVKPITLLGRKLAIYRGETGQVFAVDAYCPHMGAHLAEGKVEGNGLRCFFHNWKFDAEGICVDSPCLGKPISVTIKTWPTAEKYGMIWVWTGEEAHQPIPFVPELKEDSCDVMFAARFEKNCHPNVVMINAIDAHHFNTVHNLPVDIVFQKKELSENAITFSNITRGGDDSWFVKLIRPLYQNEVTYKMCYWYGSTGTVTLGPDFFHFHIMFALRLTETGKTEGQTLLLTQKRPGFWGWIFNRFVLWITWIVGNYFAKGDTQIFQTIKFDFKTPTKADKSIIEFIDHVEGQTALTWETWQPVKR